ncbi:MAG TPA: CAP domain-containing protein [Candidatus Levybacteria bacterium]|nr:CAP domain-containing protein [Candidatus Levybacteria bacterium]
MHRARIFLFILTFFIVLSFSIYTTVFYLNSLPVEAAPAVAAKMSTSTPTKTDTPTPISAPIISPPTQTPVKIQVLTVVVTPVKEAPQQQSMSEYLLEQVNDYRKANGLFVVSSTPETCSFAQIRAGEITTNFTHEGFTNRIANHTLPYTTYSIVTENIAFNSNPMEVIPQWINSAMHAENMRKNTQFACIGISGNYFVFEGLGH